MMFVLLACLVGTSLALPFSGFPLMRDGVVWDGKFGECPDVVVTQLMCAELDSCVSDMDCSGTRKCCANTCSMKVCLHPVAPASGAEKPGQCPALIQQPADLCTTPNITCLEDIECTSVQKCCDTACGDKRCLVPTDVDEIIEQKWKSFMVRKKDYINKLIQYPPPPYFFQEMYNKTDAIKMCTATPCEWKKCQHMANEFTYTLMPKREWGCALATSTEHCMFWLQQGYVDIMVTRDDDIVTAKTKYNLKPIAYEVPYTVTDTQSSTALKVFSEWQNITMVIAPVGTNIGTWSELAGATSCHAHANSTSAFKAPICSLIQKDIIPKKGDFVESASEFFDEMCVPDILMKTYNKNETYPENLVGRCPQKDQQMKYEGVEGSLKCIDETKGQVTFVDHKVIQKMIKTEIDLQANGQPVPRPVDNYKLICQDRSYPLTDWQVKLCHVSMTAHPTIYMTPKKDTMWKENLQMVLKDAVKQFTGKLKTEDFHIFESTPYTCPMMDLPGTNLIFLDESKNFTMIMDEDTYAEDFINTVKPCNELQSKPRAKFCMTTEEQYTKCVEMKKYFDKTQKVKDVAWGCVIATNDMECMKAVMNGTADLMSTDAMKTFIAGHDFKLQPIISQYLKKEMDEQTYDWKTYTYTVGVMKKSFVTNKFGMNAKYINLTKLNTCHAGVYKVSSFHHPIGYLLANGTIPRIGSVFESVSRFFDNSCLPGVHPDVFRLDKDLLLGHELNWGKPGLHFFNFTQPEWFIWNSPHTWTYLNWQGKTPSFFRQFFNMRHHSMKASKGMTSDVDPSMFSDMYKDSRIDVKTLSAIIDQLPTEISNQLRYARQTVTKIGAFDTTNEGLSSYLWPQWTMQDQTKSRSQKMTDKINSIVQDSDTLNPIVSKMWSQLLQMRFDAIDQVEEMMDSFYNIPSMMNIKDEENNWLSHPAVKSFLQVYTPQVLHYFSELFDNNEIREREFSRYSNPLWLSPTFDDFMEVTKSHQEKLCQRCIGYDTAKCSLTDPFSGYLGSMKCLKDNGGDITFVESHQLDKMVEDVAGLDFHNIVLVCPTGKIVDYVKGDVGLIEGCNFGRVPQPAIVTAYNQTGSYRWNVTKALLHAQMVFKNRNQNSFNFKMFGPDSVFDPLAIELYPINLINQTHEPWLGPMFLRSMEAIIKPSSFDWWKDHSNTCWGETYTNVITQRNGTCNTIVKDVTCVGNPPMKVVYLGRVGEKEKMLIKMCSRPTRFVRQMAEFNCDNGNTYLKMITVPTACECVPCEETVVSAPWNKDYFWTTDERKFISTTTTKEEMKLWGNEDFWADNTINPNFNLKEEIELKMDTTQTNTNMTPKDTTKCEAPWIGDKWHTEWYPESSIPMCRLPGPSREELIKRVINRWN